VNRVPRPDGATTRRSPSTDSIWIHSPPTRTNRSAAASGSARGAVRVSALSFSPSVSASLGPKSISSSPMTTVTSTLSGKTSSEGSSRDPGTGLHDPSSRPARMARTARVESQKAEGPLLASGLLGSSRGGTSSHVFVACVQKRKPRWMMSSATTAATSSR
jgi:hypothetical protein